MHLPWVVVAKSTGCPSIKTRSTRALHPQIYKATVNLAEDGDRLLRSKIILLAKIGSGQNY
jgi:hypothetical protein